MERVGWWDMTVVIAQQFAEGIVIIADSRVSIGEDPWADVAQKLFFLGPDLAIGFAGDIEFAGATIYGLSKIIKKKPELGVLDNFVKKAPEIMRLIWDAIPEPKAKRSIGFIIAGLDRSKPQKVVDEKGKVIGYIPNMFEMSVIKLSSSENFLPRTVSFEEPFVIIGSGKGGIEGLEKDFRDLQNGNFSEDLSFKAVVMETSLRQRIRDLGIDTVGGLSQIAVIGASGSHFVTYEGKKDLKDLESHIELIHKNGRFIQKDHKTGKEVTLLHPAEVINLPDNVGELFAKLEDLF